MVLAGGGTLLSSFSNAEAYTLEGVVGTIYVSEQRLSPGVSAYRISAVVGGELIASQPWVEEQIAAIPAPTGGGGGATLLGSYTGTLSNTVWTDTTLTPKAGKSLLSVVYVGSNTFQTLNWNGWGMSWFPRTRFDATNTTDGAWRYNFRSTGSKVIYMGRAANGNIQLRITGDDPESFEFEFWEM